MLMFVGKKAVDAGHVRLVYTKQPSGIHGLDWDDAEVLSVGSVEKASLTQIRDCAFGPWSSLVQGYERLRGFR